MKTNEESARKGKRPPEMHISQQNKTDLERFRAAAAKLTARQRMAVIRQMLEKPDIP